MVDIHKLIDLGDNDLVVKSIQTNASVGGTGVHVYNGDGTAPSSVTTTSTTVTTASMLKGVFVNAAATAVTLTLDTAANVVSTLNSRSAGANVGDMVEFTLINGGSSTGAITVGAGTGGSFDTNVPAANKTVAINTQKVVTIRLTNVTSGSEAYTIYL